MQDFWKRMRLEADNIGPIWETNKMTRGKDLESREDTKVKG